MCFMKHWGRAVKTVSRYWERGPGASVKRWGFPLVPNLGGTAHSFTGSALNAAIPDLFEADVDFSSCVEFLSSWNTSLSFFVCFHIFVIFVLWCLVCFVSAVRFFDLF